MIEKKEDLIENKKQVKVYLNEINEKIKELQEIEESLLLTDFFYTLKMLFNRFNTKKILIDPDVSGGDDILVAFTNQNGRTIADLYRKLREASSECREEGYEEIYKKTVQLLDKKFYEIDVNTTVTEFLSLFEKNYNNLFLKHNLENNLNTKNNATTIKSKI